VSHGDRASRDLSSQVERAISGGEQTHIRPGKDVSARPDRPLF